MVSTLTILFASGLSLFLVWAVSVPGCPISRGWKIGRRKSTASILRSFGCWLIPAKRDICSRRWLRRNSAGSNESVWLWRCAAGFGEKKCRYVDEVRATGENGRKSQVGQGSGGIDPWGASGSGKHVAGSAMLMAEVVLPGLDVIASGGRNAVWGIAHVPQPDSAATAVGPQAGLDSGLKISNGQR